MFKPHSARRHSRLARRRPWRDHRHPGATVEDLRADRAREMQWAQIMREESTIPRPLPFTRHRAPRRHSQTVKVRKIGRFRPIDRPVPRRNQHHHEYHLSASERLAVAILVRKISIRTGTPIRRLIVCVSCGKHRTVRCETSRMIAAVDGWLNGRCGSCQ